MIPYGRQDVRSEDVAAVVEVLRSIYLTQGPQVPRFEAMLADYCGAARAVAVNSGTSALHVACRALGLGPGDLLWTTPITFVSSANCALHCGAAVDFVDIDPQTWNISPSALADKLAAAARAGRLPKVLVPVHLAGQSCEMAEIAALCREHGVRIVEDAAHALGGRYRNRPVGDCTYCDIAVFSFHPVKIITTAEGGVATTNDEALARRMAILRTHGITRDADLMELPSDGIWHYQQVDLGLNYRMTELQAALGVSQMARVDAYVAERHRLAARYDQLLADLPLTLPTTRPECHSALHLYLVLVDDPARRRPVFDAMRAKGIVVNVHYIPVHTQPYYRAMGFRRGDFPVAEDYYSRTLSLPMFPTLSDADQDYVVESLQEALA